MKIGYISKEGDLVVFRKREVELERVMLCIYKEDTACGDWCPHFGEPHDLGPLHVSLELCHGKILDFEELVDMRGK